MKERNITVGISEKNTFDFRFYLPFRAQNDRSIISNLPVDDDLLHSYFKGERSKAWWHKSALKPQIEFLVTEILRMREDIIHKFLDDIIGDPEGDTIITFDLKKWKSNKKIFAEEIIKSIIYEIDLTKFEDTDSQSEIIIRIQLPSHQKKLNEYFEVLRILRKTDKPLYFEHLHTFLNVHGFVLQDLDMSKVTFRKWSEHLKEAAARRKRYLLKGIASSGAGLHLPKDDPTYQELEKEIRSISEQVYSGIATLQPLPKVKQKSNSKSHPKPQKKPKKGTRRGRGKL